MGAPSFSGRGGGQDRARGYHLTAANMLSTFGRFNQWGWEGAVRFRPIQPVGVRMYVNFYYGDGGGGGGGGGWVPFSPEGGANPLPPPPPPPPLGCPCRHNVIVHLHTTKPFVYIIIQCLTISTANKLGHISKWTSTCINSEAEHFLKRMATSEWQKTYAQTCGYIHLPLSQQPAYA